MKMRPRKAVFIVLTLFVIGMFGMGLGFVFGKIPPNAWLGLQPNDAAVGEDQWYALNQVGGYAVIFCASITGIFLFSLRKMKVSTSKVFIYTFIALFLSATFASIFFNYLLKFINI